MFLSKIHQVVFYFLKGVYQKISNAFKMEEEDKEMTKEQHEEVGDEDDTMEDTQFPVYENYPNLTDVTKKLMKMKYCIVKNEEDKQHRFLQTKTLEKFKFIDQKHYDKLGDVLCDWIQALMMDKFKLRKIMVPLKDDLAEGKAQAPIFVSKDWETNKKIERWYWFKELEMWDLDIGQGVFVWTIQLN